MGWGEGGRLEKQLGLGESTAKDAAEVGGEVLGTSGVETGHIGHDRGRVSQSGQVFSVSCQRN